MERIVYLPLFILAILGFLLLGASKTTPQMARIAYTTGNKSVQSFLKGNRYVLSLKSADSSHVDHPAKMDTLLWVFTAPDGEQSFLYQLSPVHTFVNRGEYIIDSYQLNGSLLATDTILVDEGEYIAFDFAEASVTEGNEAVAFNKSTYQDAEYEWVVLTENGEELLMDTDDTLRINTLGIGTYTVQLHLFQNGNKISSQEKKLAIIRKYIEPKPQPKRENSKPVAIIPKSKPSETPSTQQPKSRPSSTESSTEGWYTADKGFAQFVLGPPVPKKEKSHFSGGSVILKLIPKKDVQLSSFSFWGNHNTGNYSVVYECLTCKDDSQKRLRPFVFRTGNDFYEAQSRSLDSKSIGFKQGHSYKISFTTQESTEMQFEVLEQTKYEDANLSLEFLTDRSSIFGLTFLKRQE